MKGSILKRIFDLGFLKNIKISQKILFLIISGLVVFLLFSVGTFFIGKNQIKTLDEIYNSRIVPLNDMRVIQLLFREMEYRMVGVMADVTAPIGSGEHLSYSLKQIDEKWADAKKRIDQESLSKEIAMFEEGLSGFKEIAGDMLVDYFENNTENIEDYLDQYYDYKPMIFKSIDSMVEKQEKSVQEYNESRRKFYTVINTFVVTISVIAIAIFLFFGVTTIRSVSKPINNTIDMIKSIAEGKGDLTKRLDDSKKDEIGHLSGWFNKFMSGMQFMVKDMLNISRRISSESSMIESTSRLVYESSKTQMEAIETTSAAIEEVSSSAKEIANETEELNTFTEDASATSYEMSASVSEIVQHADKLESLTDSTASSINQIAVSLKQVGISVDRLFQDSESVASTMTELSKSINEVSNYSKEQATVTENVKRDASEMGLTSVKRTMEGIQRIKDDVLSTSGVVTELGEMSKDIGNILGVIHGIADTTSLLSLNAAILAAQAGEHGKGFAVVAEEVKGLADRTALSTKEIEGIINQVQDKVNAAERAMKVSIERVEEGVKLSKDAENALEKIIESSSTSLDMAKKVEFSIEEQTRGVEQVTQNIIRVSSMVDEIKRATEEQNRASNEIVNSTEQVRSFAMTVKKSIGQQSQEINNFTTQITNASDRMKAIARAASEQRKSVDNIVKALETIMAESEKNVKTANELGNMVKDLDQEGTSLKRQVESFTV